MLPSVALPGRPSFAQALAQSEVTTGEQELAIAVSATQIVPTTNYGGSAPLVMGRVRPGYCQQMSMMRAGLNENDK